MELIDKNSSKYSIYSIGIGNYFDEDLIKSAGIIGKGGYNFCKDIYENNGKAEEACEILVKRASSEWRKENNKTMDDISCVIIFLNVK